MKAPRLKGLLRSYQLRLRRRRYRVRAYRKGMELSRMSDKTAKIAADDVLLFCVLRNERVRLPYFLRYYRRLGIKHFIIVDNGSQDGTTEYLSKQNDVSLWHTERSYKRARFGVDWLNFLLERHGNGHWCLTVDIDEFFVFPHSDSRKIPALTHWLEESSLKSFGVMLLDMYSRRPYENTGYREGSDPFRKLNYFDSGNYSIRKNLKYGNLWIQGGPRQRVFFADDPEKAPALNKIPLVKWRRGYVYVSSTHSLLPRGLNLVYDEWGGEKATGCLLHAKFLNILRDKALEELERNEHYAAGREYRAYGEALDKGLPLWTEQSVKYEGWRQLEEIGLMSSGGWI